MTVCANAYEFKQAERGADKHYYTTKLTLTDDYAAHCRDNLTEPLNALGQVTTSARNLHAPKAYRPGKTYAQEPVDQSVSRSGDTRKQKPSDPTSQFSL